MRPVAINLYYPFPLLQKSDIPFGSTLLPTFPPEPPLPSTPPTPGGHRPSGLQSLNQIFPSKLSLPFLLWRAIWFLFSLIFLPAQQQRKSSSLRKKRKRQIKRRERGVDGEEKGRKRRKREKRKVSSFFPERW